jgi:hypothetical protein
MTNRMQHIQGDVKHFVKTLIIHIVDILLNFCDTERQCNNVLNTCYAGAFVHKPAFDKSIENLHHIRPPLVHKIHPL